MRYFFVVLFFVIVCGFYLYNRPTSNIETKVEAVVIDNSLYYPSYLPYISDTALDLSIQLPSGVFSPSTYTKLSGTGFHNEYLSITDRLYIVQFKEDPSVKTYMEKRPVRVFPENVYIVSASNDELVDIINDDNVNFVDHYHPHYKLDPKLVVAYYNQTIKPETKLKVIFTPHINQDEVEYIVNSIGPLAEIKDLDGVSVIYGLEDRQQLFNLALNPLLSEISLVD